MLSPDGYGHLSVLDVDASIFDTFTCGKQNLDEFITKTALPFQEARLGFTRVVFHEAFHGPVGYFTLSNDAIPLNPSERFELGLAEFVQLPSFPAVKLGRLAVHRELQGKGVGSAIMDLIIGEVADTGALCAGRLIVVDADNEPAVLDFYRKVGFEKSLWAEAQARNHGGSRKNRTAATVKMHRDILKG